MKSAHRRALGLLAMLIVVVGLIGFARHVDWHSVISALHGVDSRILAIAVIVNLVSLAMKGAQWWVLLLQAGVRSVWLVIRATTIGAALNSILIAQSGEGARVVIVSKASGVPSARVVAALALDRIIDLLSFAAILVGAATLMTLPPELTRWRGAAAAVFVLVIIGLVFLGRTNMTVPALKADAVLESVGSRIRSYMATLTNAAREMSSPARLSWAAVLSMAAWLLQALTYHLVAVAAHLPLPLAGSLAAQLACTLGFIVRATPGNIGIFQLVYVLTVRPFGITESAAIAVAILIQAIQILPTLAAAAVVAPGLRRFPGALAGVPNVT